MSYSQLKSQHTYVQSVYILLFEARVVVTYF